MKEKVTLPSFQKTKDGAIRKKNCIYHGSPFTGDYNNNYFNRSRYLCSCRLSAI